MPAHEHLGYQNPVIPVDSPDPGVFYDEASSTWYAYATNGNGKNIQVFSSKDFCSWDSDHEDALPGPFPDWIREGGWWWAPEVIRAPGGRPGYLMYTTCGIKAIDGQGICTAYSESPLGPFKLVGDGPLVDIPNGSLDAQPFENPQENGKRYLVYKNDEDGQMYTKKTQLWIQPLTEDGLRFEGPRQPLLAPTMEWQHGLFEGPYLTYHAPSRTYTLFYSSGTFTTGGYAIGYAKSSSMFGPYKASDHPFLWTDEQRGVLGPGGQCIVRGVEGHDFLVFHSLTHFEGPRHMCVHRLEWGNDGTPILPGRPQLNKRLRLGAEAEDDDQGGKPCPLPKEHYGGGGKEPKDRAREYAKKGVGALASWAKKQL